MLMKKFSFKINETLKHVFILFFVSMGLFFLGNGEIWITDPVESNYTETAKEMLFSGDYVSPRIYGNFWYDKPIFFYLELIAAFKIFGINEFAARFFPAVFGMLGVFTTYFFARHLYDRKTGFYAAIILLTSFEYWLLSKTIITDMTLFVFFSLTLIFFYLAYRKKKTSLYYFSYAFAALATLTKGPVGIVLPGIIILIFIALTRRANRFFHSLLVGLFIFFGISLCWYYPMFKIHGQAFIDNFFGVHNILRATVSEHKQWDVWYYYLAIFFLGFFPWSLTVFLAFKKYWVSKKSWLKMIRKDEKTLYLFVWALTVNIFFQCMATKYSTYTLPAMLPCAILLARFLRTKVSLVKRMFFFNIFFYILLTFLVAIPACTQMGYSAKDIGEFLEKNVSKEDMVLIYGDYSASAVFYFAHPIYLIDTKERIEHLRPDAKSWNAKNVMPMLSFREIPKDKRLFLIVDQKRKASFDKEFSPFEWQLVAIFTKRYIYVHEKNNFFNQEMKKEAP